MWFLVSLLLGSPAEGGTYIQSFQSPITLPMSGGWPRVFPDPETDGYHFLWAQGGNFSLVPMSSSLWAQDFNRVDLTAGTVNHMLKDHSISPCPSGGYLHIASANVSAPNGSAYAFRYDDDFNLVSWSTIEESIPQSGYAWRAHNDMPSACSDHFMATVFGGQDGANGTGPNVISYFFMFDDNVNTIDTTELTNVPQTGGATFLVEEETGDLLIIEIQDNTDVMDITRVDVSSTPFSVTSVISHQVLFGGDSGGWPQAALRVNDYYIVAFINQGNGHPGLVGDVVLAVFDFNWNLLETEQVTSSHGAMTPGLARRDDQLVVVYDYQVVPHVVEVTLDSAAFGGLEESDDADGDGYDSISAGGDDCDDTDASINTGATETCDGVDNNCDGQVDENCATDADGDGYDAVLYGGTDCDDTDSSINPGAPESCDGIDNDCNSQVDDDPSSGGNTWYADLDNDGYGDPGSFEYACSQPFGTVANNADCDDTNALFYPGAPETCGDTQDYNCDGAVQYSDNDQDGYAACEDCDDNDASAYPSNTEICDGVDNDCNGTVDEHAIDQSTWYRDNDGDGFGNPSSSSMSCTPASGWVADTTDCNDIDASIHPGAVEYCDGVDNDCDGSSDEADAVDPSTWHLDSDGDGFGDASVSTAACSAPSGYVADSADCDDTSAQRNPDQVEVCDGLDNDCNDVADDNLEFLDWYTDSDGDGYGDATAQPVSSCAAVSGSVLDNTDCDDTSDGVNPGLEEAWYDGVDQDCDGNDNDQDEDGFAQEEDCDDTDAEIFPGSPGLDEDCNALDTGVVDTGDESVDEGPKPYTPEGCGCASQPTGQTSPGYAAGLLFVLGLVRTRRKAG